MTEFGIKKKIGVLMGYHYLALPLYDAMREQLVNFDVYLVNPKDTIGSATNSKYFDHDADRKRDLNYLEIDKDPPWYRTAGGITSYGEKKTSKIKKHLIYYLHFIIYKRYLRRFFKKHNFDFIFSITDQSYTYQLLQGKYPSRLYLIQPCYLDLWQRPNRLMLLKWIANVINPGYFPMHDVFGMGWESANLLVWEKDSINVYEAHSRNYTKVRYPVFEKLRNDSSTRRSARPREKPTVSILPANYSLNHGSLFQEKLELAYDNLIVELSKLDVEIIIKIHPNESIKYWREKLERANQLESVRWLEPSADRIHLFYESDFLICTNSYSAVEASLCGVLVLNFLPTRELLETNFVERFDRYCHLSIDTCGEIVAVINENERFGYHDQRQQVELEILGGGDAITLEEVIDGF